MTLNHRNSLGVLVIALMIAGCQTEDIHALADSCPNFEAIWEHDKMICTRETSDQCFDRHDTANDMLKQSDFIGAFANNRCPKGYRCNQDEKICEMEVNNCQNKDRKCENGNIYVCDEDGNWRSEPILKCETGCSE